MGPCFRSTEDYVRIDGITARRELQWGRASGARKTACRDARDGRGVGRFNGAVLQEHGRRRTRSKPRSFRKSFNGAVLQEHGRHWNWIILRRKATCFNGAVLQEHGRLSDPKVILFPTTSFNGAVLQEHGRHDEDNEGDENSDASMGPCFRSTEDRSRSA